MQIISDSTWGYEVEGGTDKEFSKRNFERMGFKVCHDCSVNTRTKHDELEIKIDGFFEDSEVIEKSSDLIELLNDINFITNDSCGIHIHVGKFNPVDVLKTAYWTMKMEKTIFQLFPERLNASYIGDSTQMNSRFYDRLQEIPFWLYKELDNKSIIEKIEEYGSYYEKSCGTNIGAYFDYGTVEFRLFRADYNALIAYIDFIDKIVNFIKGEYVGIIDEICNEFLETDEPLLALLNSYIFDFDNSTIQILTDMYKNSQRISSAA